MVQKMCRPEAGDMKPLKAWAIVHSGDQVDCWDHRVPVFWLRSIAAAEKLRYTFADSRVVRVEIREVKKRRTARKQAT